MNATVLNAIGLTKRYGSFTALNEVSFNLDCGEIHGLCGENGAGKSTLIKILGGVIKPEAGVVTIQGEPLKLGRKVDPEMISIVHQELSIVPDMSVLDNLLLNNNVPELYNRSRYSDEGLKVLAMVGLGHLTLSMCARELSIAEQQLLEIARGLISGAKVLLLDEPTATLTEAEIVKVFAVLRSLRDMGSTIVLVSHRLDEIFEITDRVSVFRSGKHVLTEKTALLSRDALINAMIGRELVRFTTSVPEYADSSTEELISLKDYGLKDRFGPLNFSVAKGEIVALVGQLGSGADLVIEALAGLHPGTNGEVRIDKRPVQILSINQSHALGISYVPEDRASKGVFLDECIELNITTQILSRISRFGFISESRAATQVTRLATQFTIATNRLSLPVSSLSGGNQQKVSLAKAVAMSPRLLLLNEPTRGVDIGARSEIYNNLRQLTRDGMSILLYSSDLEEVMDVSDVVVSIYRGRQVSIAPKFAASTDSILSEILHGYNEVRS